MDVGIKSEIFGSTQFYPKYGVCKAVDDWIGKTVGHG